MKSFETIAFREEKSVVHGVRCCLLVLYLFPIQVTAQPDPPADGHIDNEVRKEAIDSLASILIDRYYDPPLAKSMVSKVRKYYEAGRYDTIQHGQEFAMLLTKDLQEISQDKHIEVEYVNQTSQSNSLESTKKKRKAFMGAVNRGFDKVERLPGNVGLLELRTFSTIADAAPRVDGATKLLTNTDALIIDLRYNGGGHPATVQYLASYLLDNTPKHLNTMVWRSSAGNQPVSVTRKAQGPGLQEQSWPYSVLPGSRYDQKPVYILISEITALGAEEFAYALQALGRANSVGGTSAGAANPGGTDPLTANFQVFVPRGQAVNPITRTSWERTGVKPDISSDFDLTPKVAYVQALNRLKRREITQGLSR